MKEERGEGEEEREEGEEERGEGRGEGGEWEGGKEERGGRREEEGEGSSGARSPFLPPLRHNVDNFVADIQTLEEGISCLQQNLFLFPFSVSL